MAKRCGDLGHRSKQTGEPCGALIRDGAVACKWHGGASPQAQRKAAERVLDQQVRETLIRLDITPVDNPLEELAKVAGEARAFKDQLAAHVQNLTELRYRGGSGEQIRAELTLYRDALRDLGNLLVQFARLNIDDRLARIEERQAELIADALTAVLAGLNLSRDQQLEARRGLVRRLRSVG